PQRVAPIDRRRTHGARLRALEGTEPELRLERRPVVLRNAGDEASCRICAAVAVSALVRARPQLVAVEREALHLELGGLLKAKSFVLAILTPSCGPPMYTLLPSGESAKPRSAACVVYTGRTTGSPASPTSRTRRRLGLSAAFDVRR